MPAASSVGSQGPPQPERAAAAPSISMARRGNISRTLLGDDSWHRNGTTVDPTSTQGPRFVPLPWRGKRQEKQ
ncbi:hypothetical protein GCM10022275_11000 [Tessaracoccus defluvii]